MAPILPLTVMTIAIRVLPRTQAPIAYFQLRPTAMIEDAIQNVQGSAFALSDREERMAHTNFPIRDGPGVGHPVGHIGAPIPGTLRRRNGVEVGIGRIRRGGETRRLLIDNPAEAMTLLESGGVAHFGGRRRIDGGDILLVRGASSFVVGGRHGRLCFV